MKSREKKEIVSVSNSPQANEYLAFNDMVNVLYDLKKKETSYKLTKEEFSKMVYLGLKFQGEEEPSKEIENVLSLYQECLKNKKTYAAAKGRLRFLQKTKKMKESDFMDIVLVISGMILLFIGSNLLSEFYYIGISLLVAGVLMYTPLVWQCLRRRGKIRMEIRQAKAKTEIFKANEEEVVEKMRKLEEKYLIQKKDGHLVENLKLLLSEAKEYEYLKECNNIHNGLLKRQAFDYLQSNIYRRNVNSPDIVAIESQ